MSLLLPVVIRGLPGLVGGMAAKPTIRPLAGSPIDVESRRVRARPRYRLIAESAVWLCPLWYPDGLIALCVGVTRKTLAKVIRASLAATPLGRRPLTVAAL